MSDNTEWVEEAKKRLEFFCNTADQTLLRTFRREDPGAIEFSVSYYLMGAATRTNDPVAKKAVERLVRELIELSESELVFEPVVFSGMSDDYLVLRASWATECGQTSVYVDPLCRIYKDWQDFLDNNRIPFDEYIYLVDDLYDSTDGEGPNFGWGLAPRTKPLARIARAVDVVACLAGMIAGWGLTLGVLRHWDRPVMGTLRRAGFWCAMWTSLRLERRIVDMSSHRQSLTSPEARGYWFSLATSLITAFSFYYPESRHIVLLRLCHSSATLFHRSTTFIIQRKLPSWLDALVFSVDMYFFGRSIARYNRMR